jgi:hypothetical protein
MEQLITCKICFEDKNSNIILQHINPIGNVSNHQMCDDCYKMMRVNCCPFCRCEIVIPEISKLEHKNAVISIFNEYPNGNRNYNILRIIDGLAYGGYSN